MSFDLLGIPAISFILLFTLASTDNNYLTGMLADPQLTSNDLLPSTIVMMNSNINTNFSYFLGS